MTTSRQFRWVVYTDMASAMNTKHNTKITTIKILPTRFMLDLPESQNGCATWGNPPASLSL